MLTDAGGYALVGLVVFGVNLLPAFGPPTWAVLVLFRLNLDLAAVPLVLCGAVAAAAGRLCLGHGASRFRGHLSQERVSNLEAARVMLGESRGRAAAGLGLFALSPVPSAQLFIGAGLLGVRLLPLTAAFFAGRLVSYSLYVGAASATRDSLGSIFSEALTSPVGIATQVAMLAALVVFVRIDWAAVLRRRVARGARSARGGLKACRP